MTYCESAAPLSTGALRNNMGSIAHDCAVASHNTYYVDLFLETEDETTPEGEGNSAANSMRNSARRL